MASTTSTPDTKNNDSNTSVFTLVLLRHGQSIWNLENKFTGWTDVDLSDKGITEARAAGKILAEEGYSFDLAYTSVLKRAIRTLWLCLEEMDLMWIPVHRRWQLNERHYGALQGLDKAETSKTHGEEQVFIWRRSYATPPPELDKNDERHPGQDPRYQTLSEAELPTTESLSDTVARVIPLWEEELVPAIKSGKKLLIAAHGNSLRALFKHLKGISDDDISGYNIPTGIPLVFKLNEKMQPVEDFYLGDEEAVRKAAESVANQAKG